MVCVEGGPLYSALRSVPAKAIHGNTENRLQEDQNRLPAKMHLEEMAGSAEPWVRPAPPWRPWPPFLRETTWWALILVRRCRRPVGRFGLVCGPLLHVLHRTQSSAMLSAYSSCFLLIPDLCSSKHKSLKTTIDLG